MAVGIASQPKAKVGMQWEIFDALKESEPRFATDDIPAAPPFKPVPMEDSNGLKNELSLLATSQFPPKRRLAELIAERLTGGSFEAVPTEIDVVLEAIWGDRKWWANFVGLIDFEDLRRPEKDLLGLEKRCMPFARDYRDSGGMLRQYQAMRVNRLIVETILPPRVFPRAEYLNTRKVAEFVKSRYGTGFETIVAYAHPQHFEWCSKNVKAVLGVEPLQGWVGDEIWDPLSAQVWTRSAGNYRIYNSI